MLRFIRVSLMLLVFLSVPIVAQEDDDPNVTIHVVQRGENLFRIALSYGLTVDALAEFNNIADVSSIEVGQRLLIPLDVPVEAPLPQVHVVQPGESLMSIARTYDLDVDDLLSLNELPDPNTVYVGQTLVIGTAPAQVETVESVDSSEESAPTPTNITSAVHVVQRGETLFRIATSYGLTVTELQEANAIADPTRIFSGQELIIPGVQPEAVLDLPDIVSTVEILPLTLVEGQTGRLQMTTASASQVIVSFLGMSPNVVSADGVNFTVFLAVPVWTEPGVYPVTLTITPPGGIIETVTLNVRISTGPYGSQNITLPADRLELLSAAVEDNELNILRNAASGFTAERYFDGPLGLPAAAAMNSPFGTRRSYNGSAFDRFHSGADFAGAPGSPVLAAASGRVVLADTLNIRGVSLMIDHGWGVFTQYAHLTDRFVQLGDFVNAGDTIGTVGSTGRATGAHLHWELWVNGVQVDPMQWVRQAFP